MNMGVEFWWNDADRRELKYLEKNSALSHHTSNMDWLWMNLGLRSVRPVANHLGHSMT
jgi:hypothetical protein